MGGNIYTMRRIDRQEFDEMVSYVFDRLSQFNRRMEVIPFFRNKDSFGDLDIIIQHPTLSDAEIRQCFGESTPITRNGSVVSIQVKEFQVDLIFTASELFDTSINYFSWNDLGNLVGRIFHKTGFKYGHRGLSLIVRDDDDHIISEIDVTKDIDIILNLIGLDPSVFHQGFNTKDEIFEYVVSCPYFNSQIFLLDNRSHKSKIRDRKRTTYSEFLMWIKDKKNLPSYPWKNVIERGGYRENKEWVDKVCSIFPDLREKIDITKERSIKRKVVQQKFSGHIVKSITKLSNKHLGDFIIFLKNSGHTPEDFEHFVYEADSMDVVYWIDYLWEKHKIRFYLTVGEYYYYAFKFKRKYLV